MHHYTLAFLRRRDEVLLINRIKSPWMGSWNGIGGKIVDGEDPLSCIQREIEEESGIVVSKESIRFQGILTWENFVAKGNGLYLFVVDLEDDFDYATPKMTDEGILDWKKIDWIVSHDNRGIAENIPYFLGAILEGNEKYLFHCTFVGVHLDKVITTILEEAPW